MDEQELIEQLIAGSNEAARQFEDRYRFLVMGVCRRFRQLSMQDAEDIFARVFLRLWQDECAVLRRILANWQPGSLPRYLREIAYNMAIDCIRGAVEVPVDPRPSVEQDPGEDGFMHTVRALWHGRGREGVDPEPDPEQLALLEELQRMMREAVANLAARCRQVISYVDLMQRSYDEAAVHFDMNRNTLGVTLMRCRERLALLIETRYPALKEHLKGAL